MTTKSKKQTLADIWRRYDSVEQRLAAPLTERMLCLAKLQPGMQVLDLATGRGEPAIPVAKKVLPGGTVLGVDKDKSMLKIAREKAKCEGLTNLELVASNIETLDGIPTGVFDVALARWGLMYCKHPLQALHAARKAIVPDGLLVAALWTDPERASFFELPRVALSNIQETAPTNHNVPGTFYYADLERYIEDLDEAGFKLKYSETMNVDVIEVGSDKELVDWAQAFGMSKLLKNISQKKQLAWKRELVSLALDSLLPRRIQALMI